MGYGFNLMVLVIYWEDYVQELLPINVMDNSPSEMPPIISAWIALGFITYKNGAIQPFDIVWVTDEFTWFPFSFLVD